MLAGGVIALVGGYLGARWSARFAARHQRANLLHESRIALYVDLFADCRRRDNWLDALCDSFRALKQLGESYQPAVPLDARIELLALDRTKAAWSALEAAHDLLRPVIEREGYPTHEDDLMLPSTPEVVVLRQRIAEVREAVRRDLVKG